MLCFRSKLIFLFTKSVFYIIVFIEKEKKKKLKIKKWCISVSAKKVKRKKLV